MAIAAPQESFVWGAGGTKKTPEQVKRDREIAEALMMKGADYSPVGHWLAGAARAADGLVGGLQSRWADEAETAGREGFQSQFDQIFGGGAAPIATGGPVASVPATADAAAIRDGLIARGLPEHVADGFLMNFQDESGLNPGINEQNPTVPGSRGGYGLYQLTGPRRVAYEKYAAQKGVDPSDTNAQLDFLMSELQGPEANAAKSILAAPDAGSAAAAIATNFLRPAAENLAPRVAKYTGAGLRTNVMAPRQEIDTAGYGVRNPDGSVSGRVEHNPIGYSVYDPQGAQQVASLDPSIGAPAQPQAAPAMAPQQQIAQALISPQQPSQMGGGPTMEQLIGLSSDPWANESQKAIIQSLLGQQMEQQQQANDPLRQLQIQQAQRSLDTPTEQWQKLDDHTLYNQATGETKPIDGAVGGAPRFEGTGLDAQAWNILQNADPSSKEYATAYSIIAQPKPQMVQTENGMMLVPVAPQLPAWLTPPGGSAQMAPQAPMGGGATPMPNAAPMPSQQPAMPTATPDQAGVGQLIPGTRKPSTEAQQRNEMLGTVLTSDLETINNSFDALSDPNGQLLAKIPGGLGNIWQSEEYQQAANAVSSSVANILYSVSGASANPGETENQIRNLTPQLGDKPGTIADKKRRLNTFVNAVAGASGNPELIAKAREESMRGLGTDTAGQQPAGPADIDSLLKKYGTP